MGEEEMKREVKPGRQYLGVACRQCHKPILFRELTDKPLAVSEKAKFSIPCGECHHRDMYEAAELKPFQIPETSH